MSSLLEKLGKENSKNENRQENIPPDPESENPQTGDRTGDGGICNPQAASIAHPCHACGSPIAWWDRYGGGPHCHRCRDWPTAAVVKAIAVAVNGRWLTFADANASLVADQGREGESTQPGAVSTSCGHRRRRAVACFPVVARGGTVAVDRDRLAESERFVECLDCGEWISRI